MFCDVRVEQNINTATNLCPDFKSNQMSLETDFPASWTHWCQYFLTPCGGANDMNVDKENENDLSEEEGGCGINMGRQLRGDPATFKASLQL